MKNIMSKTLLAPVACSAILTPITLVSCNDNYVEPIKQVELKDGYDPTEHGITPHSGSGLWDTTSLGNEYIKNVNSNPEIFKNDMLNGFCEAGYVDAFRNALTQYENLDSIKFGVSKPKFGSTTAWEWGFDDTPYRTISFKSRLSLKYSHHTLGSSQWFERTINLNVDYHDVIFYTYEIPNQFGWGIGLSDPNVLYESLWPYARNTKPWSINLDCSSVETITTKIDEDEEAVVYKASYYTEIIDTEAKLEAILDSLPEPNSNDMAIIEALITETALFMGFSSYYLSLVDNLFNVKLKTQLHARYEGPIVEGGKVSLEGLVLIEPMDPDITYKDAYLMWPEQHGGDDPPNPDAILFSEIGSNRQLVFDPSLLKHYEELEGMSAVKLTNGVQKLPLVWKNVNSANSVNASDTLTFLINQSNFRIRIEYTKNTNNPLQPTKDAQRTIPVNLHYNTVNVEWVHD